MKIEITIDGEPATIETLDTFERGIAALVAANDAAYDGFSTLMGEPVTDPIVQLFTTERDRLREIEDALAEVKSDGILRKTFRINA